MIVRWHVASVATPELARALFSLGVAIPDSGMFTLDLASTQDECTAVLAAVSELSEPAIMLPTTVYTRGELSAAPAVQLSSTWFAGYPQPEDEYPSSRTFDRAHYCRHCGVGARQVAPYLMSSEPKWGRRSFLTMFWVADNALFARKEVWAERLRPRGIESGKVLRRSGAELHGVVQLLPHGEASFDTRGLPQLHCAQCDRIKFVWPGSSRPPHLIGMSGTLAQSRDWFGPQGGYAYRPLVTSAAVYRSIASLAGARFEPLEIGNHMDGLPL